MDLVRLNETEGEFLDGDGRKIHTVTWRGSGPLRGCVFICHGYGERIRPYYEGVAREAVDRGMLVFGHDHIGHGQSQGERVMGDCMDKYVKPVLQHCRRIKEDHPQLPLFMIGHSMGGLIGVLAAIEDPELLTGMVLMGPLVEPDPGIATPFKVWLSKCMAGVWPSFSVGRLNLEDVTSDEEWRNRKKQDILHHHGGFKVLHNNVLLDAMRGIEFDKMKTPFLIVHGTDDRVCTPAGAVKLHAKAASKDKEMVFLEKGLHNLYIESQPIRGTTFNHTFQWIEQRIELASRSCI